MKHPNPAIVAQAAVRRLPRVALLLFCICYVLSGYVGRDAWKSADITALGFMNELANGSSAWLRPTLAGSPADFPALIPYWLGAGAIAISPTWIPLDFIARVPFGLLLALAMLATWYATYYLARTPQAQPVAFAFGGEAKPADYARAIADGALLAFIASLGLAQLSHETTPAAAQLGFAALVFFSLAALPFHRKLSLGAASLGLIGLSLSGAPTLALLFGLGGSAIHTLDRPKAANSAADKSPSQRNRFLEASIVFILTVISALIAYLCDQWRWKQELPHAQWSDWNGYAQLLIWFAWPTWPLALWTIWRWRYQLFSLRISRHLGLPAWFALVTVLATLSTGSSDRTLLLALPSLATLAAFALPTLRREMAALIDWFTLLFFSGCGFVIWVVWIAMQTGYPSQPAANVARLAPGFSPSFSAWEFVVAVAATAVWIWLVQWRVGRHRAAIWKSLVLPAGGASLCWLLVMTLWMPLLNYAQGYSVLVNRTIPILIPASCVQALGLDPAKIAALQIYGQQRFGTESDRCLWLIADLDLNRKDREQLQNSQWEWQAQVEHPVDDRESLQIFKRR